MIRGRLEAAFEHVDTGERSTAEVETGDVLLIEPRCAHAFRALEYAQVIECGTQDFDPTDAFARVVGR